MESGIDNVIATVGRWDASDLAFIERLEFVGRSRYRHQESRVTITGVLQRRDDAPKYSQYWPSPDAPSFRITIVFTGVRNLAIHGFGPGEGQVAGFDIVDISDAGWERLNYRVEDYEDGRIEFYCETFDVVRIERMPHGIF